MVQALELRALQPQKYSQYKADLLTQFERPVYKITINQYLKNLRQTGTLTKYTRAHKGLHLRTPPIMIFDVLNTCVNYIFGLKLFITRQVDFYHI